MPNETSRLLDIAMQGKVTFNQGKNSALTQFVRFLEQLKHKHCKRQWSDEYKSCLAFRKDSFFSSKTELTQFCRASLLLAHQQILSITKDIEDSSHDKINTDLINTTIVDYIFDLKQVVEHLERAKSPEFVLFSGGKSYRAESFDIFRLSDTLLNGRIEKGDHKTRQIAAVCVLRQSLESRFQRIIGIEFHDKNGRGPKLKHDFHYNFIADNEDKIELRDCNLKAIKSVYEWCNDIVHGAYQPLSWQLPFAHEICAPLFYSGESKEIGHWSIYGSARIRDPDSMRQSFLKYFSDAYEHGTWCCHFLKPDALIG